MEIRNWFESVGDLFPLDIDSTCDHHDSDDEGLELNNKNQTVQNDEALKSLNACIK